MKFRLFKIFVALLALGVGISATLLWASFNPRMESFDGLDVSKVPTVSYCDLRNDPGAFSGKIVRVKYADLSWFEHGYFFLDSACANDQDPYLIDNDRTSVSFYKANSAQIFDDLEYMRRSNSPIGVEIIAVGRFLYERPKGRSDGIEDRTAYHFEIYSIEFQAPIIAP